jgi:periplasmic protein TonB
MSFVFHVCVFLLFLKFTNTLHTTPQVFLVDLTSETEVALKNDVFAKKEATKSVSRIRQELEQAKSSETLAIQNAAAPEVPVHDPGSVHPTTSGIENSLPSLVRTKGTERSSYYDLEGGVVTAAMEEGEALKEGGSALKTSNVVLYLNEHFSYIRDLIQRNAGYPVAAKKMGWQGKTTLSFIVMRNGNVKDLRIVESSGRTLLDNSAMKAVMEASPFPQPPIEARVVIPVSYRLN